MGNQAFRTAYERLYNHYGPQQWWPAENPFEILVGAILVQNTNWQNVDKALDNLRQSSLLNYENLSLASIDEIADLIRPSGYYNIKAKRLNNLLTMIGEQYDGKLECLLDDDMESARMNLLSVKGVGPETADAILLYCGDHPAFVVDRYTHRVFSRHNLVPEECDYHELQDYFTGSLERDAQLFNEYHALIVRVAQEFCKKRTPLCDDCPLRGVEEE